MNRLMSYKGLFLIMLLTIGSAIGIASLTLHINLQDSDLTGSLQIFRPFVPTQNIPNPSLVQGPIQSLKFFPPYRQYAVLTRITTATGHFYTWRIDKTIELGAEVSLTGLQDFRHPNQLWINSTHYPHLYSRSF